MAMGRLATFEKLEGEVTVPAGVDEARRGVDQEAQPPERALALEPGDEIVGERDPLQGRAQDELAGVEDERPSVADLHQLGQILLGFLRIDVRRGVVAEDAEIAVDVQVDRRGLHRGLPQRIDHDPTRPQRVSDRSIGQDHRGSLRRPIRNGPGRADRRSSALRTRSWYLQAHRHRARRHDRARRTTRPVHPRSIGETDLDFEPRPVTSSVRRMARIRFRSARSGGCSSEAEHQLPKLRTRVRFPSPAPARTRLSTLRNKMQARGGTVHARRRAPRHDR